MCDCSGALSEGSAETDGVTGAAPTPVQRGGGPLVQTHQDRLRGHTTVVRQQIVILYI